MSQGRDAYTALAEVYEAVGWGHFSENMTDTVLTLARQHSLAPGARVVDLGCGVGVACVRFAQAGYRVMGIDLSADMLALARHRALEVGVQVGWLERDMRDWRLDQPADLVSSMKNALNCMLTPDDLGAVFECVSQALKPGALFIFDMNTIRGLLEHWGTRAYINFESEDLFIASQTCWNYETNTNTMLLHGFVRRDGGLWERWAETHVQRGFPIAEIRRLLREAGLETLAVLDVGVEGHPEAGPGTTRVLVVAQARGK